jgi:hypothetical protein
MCWNKCVTRYIAKRFRNNRSKAKNLRDTYIAVSELCSNGNEKHKVTASRKRIANTAILGRTKVTEMMKILSSLGLIKETENGFSKVTGRYKVKDIETVRFSSFEEVEKMAGKIEENESENTHKKAQNSGPKNEQNQPKNSESPCSQNEHGPCSQDEQDSTSISLSLSLGIPSLTTNPNTTQKIGSQEMSLASPTQKKDNRDNQTSNSQEGVGVTLNSNYGAVSKCGTTPLKNETRKKTFPEGFQQDMLQSKFYQEWCLRYKALTSANYRIKWDLDKDAYWELIRMDIQWGRLLKAMDAYFKPNAWHIVNGLPVNIGQFCSRIGSFLASSNKPTVRSSESSGITIPVFDPRNPKYPGPEDAKHLKEAWEYQSCEKYNPAVGV